MDKECVDNISFGHVQDEAAMRVMPGGCLVPASESDEIRICPFDQSREDSTSHSSSAPATNDGVCLV